jgi:hypothetical protein
LLPSVVADLFGNDVEVVAVLAERVVGLLTATLAPLAFVVLILRLVVFTQSNSGAAL